VLGFAVLAQGLAVVAREHDQGVVVNLQPAQVGDESS
jgi:hypothetical protein